MNPKVDAYLANLVRWKKELTALRNIVVECGMTEELKWSVPVYTYDGKNIVAINALKEFCALGFFKGALLKDTEAILERVSEHTAGIRLIRFANVRDIAMLQPALTAYIYEAIEIERSRIKMDFPDRAPLKEPEELRAKFKKMPSLKKAFKALSPGRQRAYLMHFNGAKQSKTRSGRIEKCVPRIMKGIGLSDYRK